MGVSPPILTKKACAHTPSCALFYQKFDKIDKKKADFAQSHAHKPTTS